MAQRREGPARFVVDERLGLYRCRHGVTAVLWEPDADGDYVALADTFPTEAEARAAISDAAR